MTPAGALAVVACLWLCGASVSVAAVAGTPLAQLPNAALRLTTYDGYVVFSQLDAGRWRLMAWHDGSIAPLGVPGRAIPFDADAGPSADGAPAVVFSKCAEEPAVEPVGRPQVPPADFVEGGGCQVYELALPDGMPRLVRGIYAPGASDSTPAIWRGDIAFARLTRGSRAPALYVWDHASGRLERLGAGPSTCPALSTALGGSFCGRHHRDLSASVEEMSFDGGSLVYQWILPPDAERSFTAPYAEIRVDPLRAGRQDAPSQVVYESIIGGACNGDQAGSPDVVGASVLYIWHRSVCVGEPLVSAIGSYATASRALSSVRVSGGLAVAVAQDQGNTYWIRIKIAFKEKSPQLCSLGPGQCEQAPDDYSETCAPALSVCTLMRTDNLATELKL